MWEVTVDKEKCTGDEECVEVCPVDVFEMVDGKATSVWAVKAASRFARLRQSRLKRSSNIREEHPGFLLKI
jgi:NAD-dependent dihydropyrimidine dehydrogenase PreA subunit